ncbi:MAG: CehA/McbA family metallohydrolase [Anaerolineae bacterium]
MHSLPFQRPGRFWRGNIHTHSTVSDGSLSPQAVCQFYRDNGYDFLAITDHFMAEYSYGIADTRPFRTADFTTLIGAELHTGRTDTGQLWHILAVGLPLDFAPYPDGETGPQAAARAMEAGAYVAVAHPNWYSLSEADALSLGPVHAIEVYNAIAEDHNDRADSWYMLDRLLERGYRYTACATDDAHFRPQRRDALMGWVQVRAESLDPDTLLEALKAGHYYSSTGPQIHDIEVYPGEKVIVHCSPAQRIMVIGHGYESAFAYGPTLTSAELSLERFTSPYCRVIVRDARGGRAWSNPIWFDSNEAA